MLTSWGRHMQLVTGVALALLLLIASALAVHAQGVPRLEDAITDQTGVLAADESEIQLALQELFDDTGVQLYVLFVPTTGSMEIGEYASAVAEESLGPSDALLTVALNDRTDNISIGEDLAPRVSQTS